MALALQDWLTDRKYFTFPQTERFMQTPFTFIISFDSLCKLKSAWHMFCTNKMLHFFLSLGYLDLTTTDVWGWTILFCEGLSYALQDVKQPLSSLPHGCK